MTLSCALERCSDGQFIGPIRNERGRLVCVLAGPLAKVLGALPLHGVAREAVSGIPAGHEEQFGVLQDPGQALTTSEARAMVSRRQMTIRRTR